MIKRTSLSFFFRKQSRDGKWKDPKPGLDNSSKSKGRKVNRDKQSLHINSLVRSMTETAVGCRDPVGDRMGAVTRGLSTRTRNSRTGNRINSLLFCPRDRPRRPPNGMNENATFQKRRIKCFARWVDAKDRQKRRNAVRVDVKKKKRRCSLFDNSKSTPILSLVACATWSASQPPCSL